MADYISLFVKSIFVDNMIFAYFLGMCSYLAVSKNVKTANGLGVAVVFVLLVTLPINYLLNEFLLKPGALAWLGEQYATIDLSFLSFIVFIAVIAAIVQIVEMVVEKFAPALYSQLGIFLPLITTNCAVLGVALTVVQKSSPFAAAADGMFNLGEAVVYAFATSLGFGLAMVLFAGLREQLSLNNVPKAFKGIPIALVTASILAMAFMGFSGLV